jgi:hypothetical protein
MGRMAARWDSHLVRVGTLPACLKSEVVGIRQAFLSRPGFREIPVPARPGPWASLRRANRAGQQIVLGSNLERKPCASSSRICSAPGGRGIWDRRVWKLRQGDHGHDHAHDRGGHDSPCSNYDHHHRDRDAGHHVDLELERR